MITVAALTRQFSVTVREPGLRAALGSVVRRRFAVVDAVADVSFALEGGVVLGLLGPNGSGKTTTLKCLAGLLTPTSGRVEVLGHTPSRREPDFLRRLGFVMGQRWQLHPDLPVLESFELHRILYDLDRGAFLATRAELMDLLDLTGVARAPARKLSLGQRMRCEFVAALLHRPSVVLLDEPTLGLDFEAQHLIRGFVARYVRETGAAVVLTSHYLADIEALCQRVITLDSGRIAFDGSLLELKGLAGQGKWVTAQLGSPLDDRRLAELSHLMASSRLVARTARTVTLEVPPGRSGEMVGKLEGLPEVLDVSLVDPPLEEALRTLYQPATPRAVMPDEHQP